MATLTKVQSTVEGDTATGRVALQFADVGTIRQFVDIINKARPIGPSGHILQFELVGGEPGVALLYATAYTDAADIPEAGV